MAGVADSVRNDLASGPVSGAAQGAPGTARARRRSSLWWMLLLLSIPGAASAAPSFTASLDRNVVPAGETVTLTLTFSEVAPASAPALPALPNLTVAPSVSQSSEISFINGQQTSKQSYSYTLVANQPGEITIPSMQ